MSIHSPGACPSDLTAFVADHFPERSIHPDEQIARSWYRSVMQHRLDPQNGIALNALHDKAFDRGLRMSFNEGEIFTLTVKRKAAEGAFITWLGRYGARLAADPLPAAERRERMARAEREFFMKTDLIDGATQTHANFPCWAILDSQARAKARPGPEMVIVSPEAMVAWTCVGEACSTTAAMMLSLSGCSASSRPMPSASPSRS